MKNRDELEIEFDKLINSEPLFSSIEIQFIYNNVILENDKKYMVDVERITYFDSKHKILKEESKILSKKEFEEKKDRNPHYVGDPLRLEIKDSTNIPNCLIC